jgi:hypothetical protein
LTAPQFALMAVSVANHKVRSTKLIPQVQAAIGRQLGTELEVPRSLTPELAAFVIQLARA